MLKAALTTILLLVVSLPAQAVIVSKPKTCASKVTTEYLSKVQDLRQASRLGSIQAISYKTIDTKLKKLYQGKIVKCLLESEL